MAEFCSNVGGSSKCNIDCTLASNCVFRGKEKKVRHDQTHRFTPDCACLGIHHALASIGALTQREKKVCRDEVCVFTCIRASTVHIFEKFLLRKTIEACHRMHAVECMPSMLCPFLCVISLLSLFLASARMEGICVRKSQAILCPHISAMSIFSLLFQEREASGLRSFLATSCGAGSCLGRANKRFDLLRTVKIRACSVSLGFLSPASNNFTNHPSSLPLRCH